MKLSRPVLAEILLRRNKEEWWSWGMFGSSKFCCDLYVIFCRYETMKNDEVEQASARAVPKRQKNTETRSKSTVVFLAVHKHAHWNVTRCAAGTTKKSPKHAPRAQWCHQGVHGSVRQEHGLMQPAGLPFSPRDVLINGASNERCVDKGCFPRTMCW